MQPNVARMVEGIFCLDSGYIGPGIAACYLVEQDGDWAIVETGTGVTVARILGFLQSSGVALDQIKYVMPTHVHLDHAAGAGGLMALLPRAQLVVHPRGAGHLAAPEKLIAGARQVYGAEKFTALYGEIVPVPEHRILSSTDGMTLTLGTRKLEIRHAPGHAEHHFCVWDEISRGWFSGDNFGVSYPEMQGRHGRHLIPSTTPVQFDPEKLQATLTMLMSYGPERVYLTHYGLLDHPQAQVEQLRLGIAKYCQLAKSCAESVDRIGAIEAALAAWEIPALRAVRPELSDADAQAILALDLTINAQGLDHWLKRRGSH